MTLFADIVKSALGADASSGQAEAQSQNLVNGALSMLDRMGGIDGLMNKFKQSGLGDLAASWIGSGENKSIKPEELAEVLGKDRIAALAQQAGIPEAKGAEVLSDVLPAMVDQLTPEGKAPDSNHLATLGKVLLGGVSVAVAAKVAASYFGNKNEEEPAAEQEPQTASPGAAPVETNTASAAVSASSGQVYTVVSGDTLSRIAKQYYHDANQWQRIFDANRDILNNPDRIMPGQKLRIP